MEVVEILRAAREAVDQASIPDDLKSVAFGKAVELLSGSASERAAPKKIQLDKTSESNDRTVGVAEFRADGVGNPAPHRRE